MLLRQEMSKKDVKARLPQLCGQLSCAASCSDAASASWSSATGEADQESFGCQRLVRRVYPNHSLCSWTARAFLRGDIMFCDECSTSIRASDDQTYRLMSSAIAIPARYSHVLSESRRLRR